MIGKEQCTTLAPKINNLGLCISSIVIQPLHQPLYSNILQ